ncbi:MAG: hypothetical protein P4L33_11170 [Capsulimonadaceae bacterium]|nr:hypothetical protein [Capsulimonadaceae bacterium]
MITSFSRTIRRFLAAALSIAAAALLTGSVAKAQDMATITVPAGSIEFNVTDVTKNTPASNNPQTLGFTGATFTGGDNSVQFLLSAGGQYFSAGTGNGSILSSIVQWKGTATSGTGTVTTSSLNWPNAVVVYTGTGTQGGANIWFRLKGPITGISAGTYSLTVTWKVQGT